MSTLTCSPVTPSCNVLNFKNRVLTNSQGKIKYQTFSPGGRPHYHIELVLSEPPDVMREFRRIEYRLHNTSLHPFRTAHDYMERFRITFWTWSMFPIHIRAFYNDGGLERDIHVLEYTLPPDDGFNYIEVHERQIA